MFICPMEKLPGKRADQGQLPEDGGRVAEDAHDHWRFWKIKDGGDD